MSYRSGTGEIERTTATQQQYERRAIGLQDRFRFDAGLDERSHPASFVVWLSQCRGQWSPSTWRQYRAALVAWYRDRGDLEMADAIQGLDTAGCRPRTARPVHQRNTSGRKRKQLSEDDRDTLRSALADSGSRYAGTTWLLLEAGRLAGLRPSEWPTAVWETPDPDTLYLRVRNGKATNERAHGEYRRVDMSALPAVERAPVDQLVRTAHEWANEWPRLQRESAKVLNRIARRCWPKRARYPTLYAGRHQFAADAKAAGCTEIEVAALMGHRNIRVAQIHYGRRRYGRRGGFRVQAHAEDVERVAAMAEAGLDNAAETPRPATRTSGGPSMG